MKTLLDLSAVLGKHGRESCCFWQPLVGHLADIGPALESVACRGLDREEIKPSSRPDLYRRHRQGKCWTPGETVADNFANLALPKDYLESSSRFFSQLKSGDDKFSSNQPGSSSAHSRSSTACCHAGRTGSFGFRLGDSSANAAISAFKNSYFRSETWKNPA